MSLTYNKGDDETFRLGCVLFLFLAIVIVLIVLLITRKSGDKMCGWHGDVFWGSCDDSTIGTGNNKKDFYLLDNKGTTKNITKD